MRIAPYSRDERMRWGVTDVAIALGLFFAALIVASVLVSPLPPQPAAFIAAAASYAALFAWCWRASHRRGIGSLASDFGLRFRPVDLAIGLAIGLVARGLSVLLVVLVTNVTGHVPENGNLVLGDELAWALVRGILITSLVAPFVEELFFRGLVLRAIRNLGARATASAIVVSTLLFVAMHLWQSTDVTLAIIVGATTLLLGAANAIVTVTTGRLGPAITAHVVFNASAVVTLVVG
jgi:membrane protease YdiL (CAAX protease family)